MSIYAFDPAAAPDAAFEPGELRHLVPGRRGRLLDPRRTPVQVVGLDLAGGWFEVEVQAFEDAGARWRVPVEGCRRYPFAPGEDAVSTSFSREVAAANAVAGPDAQGVVLSQPLPLDRLVHDLRGDARAVPALPGGGGGVDRPG